MRFTPLVLTGLFALAANAQSTTSSASAPLSSEQAAIVKCIEACDEGDVSCTSKCIAVPNPSEDDANDTNECVSACPKGQGTEADNAKYSDCVQDCIGQHFFTATTGAGGAVAAPTNGNTGGTGAAPTTTTGVTRTNVVIVSTVTSGSFTTTVTSTSTPSAEPSESGDDNGDDDSVVTSTSTVVSSSSEGAAAGKMVGGFGAFLLGVAAML
ncbi:hypothetical protein B0T20DRAFT_48625 [Sordaria brevicollis]|uniref:Uncharacterized protein n=1 Tax=Sordaria brevicollis TaxID=83679 RepID=A0AAE0U9U8_SORBR|nr:hypothetical protein B0T20DRAFT_48625 [Sordaria brevicollis]